MFRPALLFVCVAAAMLSGHAVSGQCSCLDILCKCQTFSTFREHFCDAEFVTRFKVESSKEVAEKSTEYTYYGKHVEVFKGAPNDTFVTKTTDGAMCGHPLRDGGEYLIMGSGNRHYLCDGVIDQWSDTDDATKRNLNTYKYILRNRKVRDAFCVPRKQDDN